MLFVLRNHYLHAQPLHGRENRKDDQRGTCTTRNEWFLRVSEKDLEQGMIRRWWRGFNRAE